MVTLKQIAKNLDVSVSTVGRALNDHPRISREMKERVRRAAEELGYVANTAAKVMRGGSSHLIGLLVPDIRSTFYSMVAQVLSKYFEGEGFHLVLSLTDDDPDVEMEHVRELIRARAAGIVVVPSAAPRPATLTLLRMAPHIQLLRRIPALGDWFGIDDEDATMTATNHLLSLGHRRIGYVGDVIFPTGKVRCKGFERAHAEANCALDKTLVELGYPDARFGAEAVARLLGRKKPPTAIITTSVSVTLGAAERIDSMKVEVPGDLSLVGFGEETWQQWWGPGLTTLRLPVEELAVGCGLWFVHRLKTRGTQPAHEPHLSTTPTTLVLRGSTARPAEKPLRPVLARAELK